MVNRNVGSLLNRAQVFLTHWNEANLALGKPLVLNGGYTRDAFAADRTALFGTAQAASDVLTDRRIHGAARRRLQLELAPRVFQFRAAVFMMLPVSDYLHAMPVYPGAACSITTFWKTLNAVAGLWGRIDADTTTPGFTPPLTLAGNYTRANFLTEIAAYDAARLGGLDRGEIFEVVREGREEEVDALYTRMKQYRKAVQSQFPRTDPIALSLPTLYAPAHKKKENGGDPATLTTLRLDSATALESDPAAA